MSNFPYVLLIVLLVNMVFIKQLGLFENTNKKVEDRQDQLELKASNECKKLTKNSQIIIVKKDLDYRSLQFTCYNDSIIRYVDLK